MADDTKNTFPDRMKEQLVEQMKAGKAPFQQSRGAGVSAPVNPINGKAYRGANSLMLSMQNREDNRWLTFNQAQQAGYKVKRGERATPIQYWSTTEKVNKIDPATGQPQFDARGNPVQETQKLEKGRFTTGYVFNAEQLEGIPPAGRGVSRLEAISRADGMLRDSGVTVKHDQAKNLFYSPAKDEIHFPVNGAVPSHEVLHKLAAATGHPDRLNRDSFNSNKPEQITREAMVTEIATMMLCGQVGVPYENNGRTAQHEGQFMQMLDKNPVVACLVAQEADRACKFVLDREQEIMKEHGFDLEADRRELMTESPMFAVREVLDYQKAMNAEPDNVHVFDHNGQQLFAAKGTEWLASVPNHMPIAGEEFSVQTSVKAFDKDGQSFIVDMEQTDRRLENGGNESVSPPRPIEITPTGRDMTLPPDWTGELAVRPFAEDLEGNVRVGGDLAPDEVEFYGVYATQGNGTQALVKDFEVKEHAQNYARLIANEYQQQTEQEQGIAAPAQRRTLEPQISEEKIYVDIPYSDRQAARKLGADFDKDAKSWFVPPGTDAAPITAKWPVHNPEEARTQQAAQRPEPRSQQEQQANADRVYVNIPYTDRQEARKLGADFDKDAKSWFVPPGADAAAITAKWPVHNPEETRNRQEAKQTERVSRQEPENRTYINVPRAEKDEAKQLGARWDRDAVSWYVPANVDPEPLTAKWPQHTPAPQQRQESAQDQDQQQERQAAQQPEKKERKYLVVPFQEKDAAKKAGAFFDTDAKKWYAGPKADMEKLSKWLPENQTSIEPTLSSKEEFAAVLKSVGAVVDGDHPVMDGAAKRIAVDGDKGAEKSGFYVGHSDGRPSGYVKNNRTQEEVKWAAKGYTLDNAEKKALQEKAVETLNLRNSLMAATYNMAAARLQKQVDKAEPPKEPTPYMQSKGIQVHAGVFASGNSTCIPAHDVTGAVRSMQYIQKDGTKRFAKNSQREGCFNAVGGMDALRKAPAIVIAEGYATAATLKESLGFATVAAFYAGNLKAVAQALHKAMPDKPIIIAGDDDHHLEAAGKANVGKVKAQEAAEAVNGKAVFPRFGEGERGGKGKGLTDFNDLAHKSKLGKDAVQSQIKVAVDREVQRRKQVLEQAKQHDKSRGNKELSRV